MNSLLAQTHNAICFGGFLHKKKYKFFTLGTVSCFSEQNIHCFNANNPQNRLHYGIVQVENWRSFRTKVILLEYSSPRLIVDSPVQLAPRSAD